MEVKKILTLNIAAITFIAFACIAATFASFRSYRQALSKTGSAEAIAREVYTRRLLADEYLLHRTERTIKQRDISYDAITRQLSEIEPLLVTEEEKELFGKLKNGIMSGQSVFNELVALDSREISMPESLDTVERLRLSGLLTVETQQAVSAASSLAEINSENVSQSLRRVAELLIFMTSAFFLMLAASFRMIWKNTAQLASEKSKIQAILSGIGDGVVVVDHDFRITRWNHAASVITGWKAVEAVGHPLQEYVRLIRAYDRKPNYAFVEEALLYAKVTHMENHTLLITKKSEEVSVGDSAAPIFDDLGKVNGVVIIFRDVSEEMAANRLHGEFAFASHQLRTPVGKSLSFLEVALQEKSLISIKKKIAVAHQSLLSTAKVVEQIIAVSEVDQGKLLPHLQALKISDVIQEVRLKLKPLLDKTGSAIDFKSRIVEPSVWSDEKFLKRALFEVIHNAVSYSPPESTIKIGLRQDKNDLIFTVTDSGIGIPDEDQSMIFTKFYRGNNLNATDLVGAGLGLYIAKAYIQALQGHIWFDSVGGKGTTFYLSVPIGHTITNKEK